MTRHALHAAIAVLAAVGAGTLLGIALHVWNVERMAGRLA